MNQVYMTEVENGRSEGLVKMLGRVLIFFVGVITCGIKFKKYGHQFNNRKIICTFFTFIITP